MQYTSRNIAFAALLVLTSAMQAVGGEYADPTGFSFTYPDTWSLATRLNQQNWRPEMREWIVKNNIDLSRVALFLLSDSQADIRENLNIVVEQQEITINDKSLRELSDVLSKQYREMGLTRKNVQENLRKIGENEVLVFEHEATFPGVPVLLRQRQAYFAGGGKTYIVTCTALASTFDEHAGTFDAILASFKVPPSTRINFLRDFDWKHVLIMAVVGGIAGGLIWVFRKIAGGRQPDEGQRFGME